MYMFISVYVLMVAAGCNTCVLVLPLPHKPYVVR